MSYQVLARKWRPSNFQELIGQEHVLKPLVNALTQQRLHHAYLFTGIQGVGKTTIARIVARSLNCETGITAQPCGNCSICTDISKGCFIDLIEVDAASRTKVEDIRELLDNVQYAPTRGRYKIYLIDEVHMLSNHSFNALLKTLEEPPAHVKFLLATTDPQRLPITILSRCLQFHLKTLAPELISQHLQFIADKESILAEPTALMEIANAANGSVRDALSILDQAIAYCENNLTTAEVRSMIGTVDQQYLSDIINSLASRSGDAILATVSRMAELNTDFNATLEALLSLLHKIAVQQLVPDSSPLEETLLTLAQAISPQDIQLFYQIALIGRRDLSLAPSARIGFEMVLLRMLAFYPEVSIASTANITQPHSSNNTKHAKQEEQPTPHSASQLTSAEQHTISKQRMDKASSNPTTPTQAIATSHPINWSELVAQMKLTGIVLALATHCVALSWDEHAIKLMLSPKHKALLNDNVLARLTQALQHHLQCSIAVEIELGESQQLSPAEQTQQAVSEREQQAQLLIEKNQHVQTIISKFNAKIVNTQSVTD